MSGLSRRAPQFRVDESDPFKHDRLDRKAHVEGVARLVSSLRDPLVMALEGTWGTGKTSFVHMLRAVLTAQGHCCVYFDAWAHDWAEDPLIPLLAEFEKQVGNALGKGKKSAGKVALAAVVDSGIKVVTLALPKVASAATKAVIGSAVTEAGQTFVRELAKEAPGLSEEATARLLRAHTQRADALASFRNSLAGLAAKWPESSEGRTTPIVVFVDELDRCRPTFALSLLERIKHAFGTEGVVFVLSADRAQLGISISAVYGSGTDAEGYLRRFVDIWYSLPSTTGTGYIEHLLDHFDTKAAFQGRTQSWGSYYELQQALRWIAEVFELPARTLERIVGQVDLAIRMHYKDHIILLDLLCLFAVLRELDRVAAEEFVKGEARVAPILEILRNSPKGRERMSGQDSVFLEAILRKVSAFNDDRQEVMKYSNGDQFSEDYAQRKTEERLRDVGSTITRLNDQHPSPNEFFRTYTWELLQLVAQFRRN